MKNIPFFTTESGVASLTLEEITYKQTAYIRIHSSVEPKKLISECADFCYAAGAKDIYITGSDIPAEYPLYTRIIRMVCDRTQLPATTAVLVPVTADHLEHWRSIYNDKMQNVPCSSTLTISAAQELILRQNAYFVYMDQELIGIGKVTDNTIDVIASCIHGAGKDIILALNSVIKGNQVYVEVAENNIAAAKLYSSMGFIHSEELTRWYRYKNNSLSNKNT